MENFTTEILNWLIAFFLFALKASAHNSLFFVRVILRFNQATRTRTAAQLQH